MEVRNYQSWVHISRLPLASSQARRQALECSRIAAASELRFSLPAVALMEDLKQPAWQL